MTDYITIEQAARLLGMNEGSVRRKCIAGKYCGAKKTNGAWAIPITCHEKFRQPTHLIGSDDLSHLPANKREAAIKKFGMIQQCEEFIAGFMSQGGYRRQAIEVFAAKNNIGFRTMYNWFSAYNKYGAMGLVDSRGFADIAEPSFSQEAADEFLKHFLTPRKLSVKLCYQNILYINKTENKGWKIPALRSVYNWVENHVPKPVMILHRQGQKAYEAACAPYIQKDLSEVGPGEIWVGDHHQLNCWILFKGKWVRPWLTCWMDMRSRCIVGWYLSPSPNQNTIMIAMRGGVEKYGPPDSVKIDNGKDYDSQTFTGTTKTERRKGYIDEFLFAGLYGMMDISVSFAIPYHPQSKPIERLFYTVDEQFTKTIATYCGNKPENKPENLNELLENQKIIDNAYNFDSLAEVFGRWVEVYNNTVHTGVGMEGRTPNQTMALRLSKRVISSEKLDMLMCVWSGKLQITKNGITFKGLLYGQYEPKLINNFGKQVRVAYNPHDLRQVTVYEAESMTRICIAEQNQLIKYNHAIDDEALRTAMRKKAEITRAHKNWIDKRGEQYHSITDLTIKALNESTVKTDSQEKKTPALRPVKTPLDLHLDEHLQEQKQKLVRKAAGAENTRIVDMDLSSLVQKQPERKLRLFEK